MITPVKTTEAPAAVGHYHQALRAGGLLFLSGQLPIDPATGKLVEGGAAALARRALDNLDAVLRAGGSRRDCVLRVTVFLTDPAQGPDVNRAFGEFFGEHRPTRTTVVVKALPLGAALEMDAIACAP